jgi:hypothetical protein
MADLEARPIAVGLRAANLNLGAFSSPTFSPDGGSIVFWTSVDRTLKKVGIAVGAAVTICPADAAPSGIDWNSTGILFGLAAKGILRVSPHGGKPELVVAAREGEQVHGPHLLPDGHTILFTTATGAGADRWDKGRIVAQTLENGERKTLIEGASDGRYLPTGHIVYAVGGVLFAVPFDPRRLAVTGGPTPVLEGVRRSGGVTGAAQFMSRAPARWRTLPEMQGPRRLRRGSPRSSGAARSSR